MSSKNLSLLGLPAKLITVSPVTDSRAEAASQPLVVGPVSPEASPEVLKICYRLLASMSEIDGTILVTGMGAGTSTSKLAVQMASGLSQVQSERVLLVDGELRGQTLHAILGVKPQPGLSELLSGRADLASSVREITPKLFILPAGALSIDVSQFASTDFAGLITRQLRREFRYVVINSAPFGEGVSANLLAPHSDGVVLAINAGQHHRDELSELKKELVGVNTKILGIVLVETIAPPLFQVSIPTTQRQKVLMVAALAAAGLGVGYATSTSVTAGVPATSAKAAAPAKARAVAKGVSSGHASTAAITPAPKAVRHGGSSASSRRSLANAT